jgi:hypothetical protein
VSSDDIVKAVRRFSLDDALTPEIRQIGLMDIRLAAAERANTLTREHDLDPLDEDDRYELPDDVDAWDEFGDDDDFDDDLDDDLYDLDDDLDDDFDDVYGVDWDEDDDLDDDEED